MYFAPTLKDIVPYIDNYFTQNICSQMGFIDVTYFLRRSEFNKSVKDPIDMP